MLVLSRRLREKVVLPNLNVTVQVVALRRGVVRLGIEAPPDVTVLREELVDEFHAPPAIRAGRPSPQYCVAYARHTVSRHLPFGGPGRGPEPQGRGAPAREK